MSGRVLISQYIFSDLMVGVYSLSKHRSSTLLSLSIATRLFSSTLRHVQDYASWHMVASKPFHICTVDLLWATVHLFLPNYSLWFCSVFSVSWQCLRQPLSLLNNERMTLNLWSCWFSPPLPWRLGVKVYATISCCLWCWRPDLGSGVCYSR